MQLDGLGSIHAQVAIVPQVATNSDSAIAGQLVALPMAQSHTVIIALGTITDANVTAAVAVTHGDLADGSDQTAVPADQLVGTLTGAGFTFASDINVRKIGYLGLKKYLRVTVTPTGNDAGSLPIAAVLVSTGLRKTAFSQSA